MASELGLDAARYYDPREVSDPRRESRVPNYDDYGDSFSGINDVLLTDSTYASFLRNMNFEESEIQSSLQAAQESAARRIQGQRSQYDEQREAGANTINSNFEARQNRTGQRLVDLNDSRKTIDRSQLQFETGINEEKSSLERQAASSIADLRRQNVDQQIAARDRLSQASITPPVQV